MSNQTIDDASNKRKKLFLILGGIVAVSVLFQIFRTVAPNVTPGVETFHDGTIVIERIPPVVNVHYKDNMDYTQVANHPRAYTFWSYLCQPQFDLKPRPDLQAGRKHYYCFEVTGVHVRLSLPIDTWLPYMAPDWLKVHENGHVEMCRDVYKDAIAQADRCAQNVLHKTFCGQADSEYDGRFYAHREAEKWINFKYRDVSETRANVLGVIYDRLTDHGKNNKVKTPNAEKEAFAEYWKTHERFPKLTP